MPHLPPHRRPPCLCPAVFGLTGAACLPPAEPIPEGSVVGMRVDFKKGNITIFLNGDHLGDMVKAGVKGPLCWMCELSSPGDCVTVNRREKLP